MSDSIPKPGAAGARPRLPRARAAAAQVTARQRAESVVHDARWSLLIRRETAGDHTFYYGVRSTGVYCKPSCRSRLPKPENVQFFATCGDAERAGYRACQRCAPASAALAGHAELVAELCRYIEQSSTPVGLRQLAERAGLSPWHTHRLFKATTGVTPKAYASAKRRERARAQLTHSGRVTDALYDSGFNSSARFYASAPRFLGMTPTEYRRGGHDVRIWFAIGDCSLGRFVVAGTGRGICSILLGDDPDALIADLRQRFPRAELTAGDEGCQRHVRAVVQLIEQPGAALSLPLDIRGTAFQEQVWAALTRIPPGTQVTYSELAALVGAPHAVRAVASACANNPLAVAVPCHRVVRKDGSLAGYRWGIERKRALLEREQGLVKREQALLEREQGLVKREQGLVERDRSLTVSKRLPKASSGSSKQREQRERPLNAKR